MITIASPISSLGCRIYYLFFFPIFSKVDDLPCAAYVGPIGSGNYVKMVHNGIEYGENE